MSLFSFSIEELSLDNIGSIPRQIQLLLILISCMVFFGLGIVFDLQECFENYKTIIGKRHQQQKLFETSSEKTSQLADLKKQVKLLQKNHSILLEQLPSRSYAAEILEEIGEHAKAFGLNLVSIKPMENQNKDFYMEYAIELSLLGSYHGFGQFLSRISNMPRILTSHDMLVQLPKNDKNKNNNEKNINERNKEGDLEIKLLVKIYWLKEEYNHKIKFDISDEESSKFSRRESIESIVYGAMDFPSPFVLSNRHLGMEGKNFPKEMPHHRKNKEALEAYPLDALEVVGCIEIFKEKEKERWVILKDKEGLLHKATVGNYIGQNFGKIENITEKTVEVKEWIQTPEGRWINRIISIQHSRKDQ